MITNAAFLGIDVGASGIKAVLMARDHSGRMRIIDCLTQPYEGLTEPAGLDSTVVGNSLRNALKRMIALPRRIRVGVAISGQSAFVRLVKIPATGPKKIRQIILYETQQQLPFPVSDVVWDFQVCARSQQTLQVLLAAVKKELANALVEAGESAGLAIEFIDVSSLALYNCLAYGYRNLDQSLVVDIGAKTTNLLVVSGGTIWTRSLPIGGNDMTEAIARQAATDRQSAEKIKLIPGNVPILLRGSAAVESEAQQKMSETVTAVLTDLKNEIIKTLNYYRSQELNKTDLVKVLLTGGVSRMDHLPRFLEDSLSLPVEKIDFFNLVAFNPKMDLQVNEQIGTAIGLALRGMGRSALNINLLPEEQLDVRKFRRQRPAILISTVCLVMAAVVWCGTQWFGWERANRYMQQLRIMAHRFEENKQNLAAFESEMASVKRQTDEFAGLLAQRHQTLAVWDAIAGALPAGLWITSLECDFVAGRVLLEGQGNQPLSLVGVFQEHLQNAPPVKSVRLETVGKEADGLLKFSLSISLTPWEEGL